MPEGKHVVLWKVHSLEPVGMGSRPPSSIASCVSLGKVLSLSDSMLIGLRKQRLAGSQGEDSQGYFRGDYLHLSLCLCTALGTREILTKP